MTSQELTKLKEIPALTDSDCSSGESDHEQSESEESPDDEEDVGSGIGKAQDDDEVRLHSFESVQSNPIIPMNVSICYRPSCLTQRTRVTAAVRASGSR